MSKATKIVIAVLSFFGLMGIESKVTVNNELSPSTESLDTASQKAQIHDEGLDLEVYRGQVFYEARVDWQIE